MKELTTIKYNPIYFIFYVIYILQKKNNNNNNLTFQYYFRYLNICNDNQSTCFLLL